MLENETSTAKQDNAIMKVVHGSTALMRSSQTLASRWPLIVVVLMLGLLPGTTLSFVLSTPLQRIPIGGTFSFSKLYSAHGKNDDSIERGLQRARAVLEKSKAKLAASKEEDTNTATTTTATAPIPFFARARKRAVSRDGVVKSKDEKTGLITADGERMAAISEEEDWEARSLDEVFQSEISEDQDVYSLASQQLADRDVAASIWGLRQRLHTEDYQRIFDKRNRFIGEDS